MLGDAANADHCGAPEGARVQLRPADPEWCARVSRVPPHSGG